VSREEFMRRAIALSIDNARSGRGGPFGAVIVRRGEIVAEGANRVTGANDPTAHAEVEAIRAACAKLGTFHLEGCEIYASCEPCPMCLGAIYWARLDRIWYANRRDDAAGAGFSDEFLYREMALPPGERSIPAARLLADEARAALDAWLAKTDRVPY
jgi:tRNA(Arg) A34 adenosine deaminase TadA